MGWKKRWQQGYGPGFEQAITRYWQRSHHVHRCVFLLSPSETSSSDGAAVYLHGMGCDATYLLHRFATAMQEARRTLVCIDLEGHGRWSRGPFTFGTLFLGELEAYLASFGIHGYHLIGQSLGGVLALAHAFECWQQDAAVASLSSVSIPTSSSSSSSHHNHVAKGSAIHSLLLITVPWHHYPSITSALGEMRALWQQEFWKHLLRCGLRQTLPAMGPIYRQRYPVRLPEGTRPFYEVISDWIAEQPVLRYLEGQSYPTLWLQGRYDRVIPPLPQYYRNLPQVDYHHAAVTHLCALLSPQVIARILRHMDQHDPIRGSIG